MKTSEGNDGQEEIPRNEGEDLGIPKVDEAGEDVDIEEEAEAQRALRDPGTPSKQEREEHELSHLPFRPWCAACIKGRAKDKMSLKLSEAYSGSGIPRVRMDNCYLTEKSGEGEGGEEETAGESATVLVVQEVSVDPCGHTWWREKGLPKIGS